MAYNPALHAPDIVAHEQALHIYPDLLELQGVQAEPRAPKQRSLSTETDEVSVRSLMSSAAISPNLHHILASFSVPLFG